jgi:hypothetical protein
MALTGLLSGEDRRKLVAAMNGISTDRFEALVRDANKIVSGPQLFPLSKQTSDQQQGKA